MSHAFTMNTMDPDIPAPSIEHDDEPMRPRTNNFSRFRDTTDAQLPSSPMSRTPFKTPMSHPATPTSIQKSRSPSQNRNERRSTPNLQPQRSSSSLSLSRGQTPSRTLLRRVSSNLNPASPTVSMRPPETLPPPFPPPLTADVVAKEFFQRELEAHADMQSGTVVFVHDSCYGHRFSRPRASKAALSTIVERPERILATLLGASTAYVRLGGRHTDGAHGPHPDTDVKTLSDPPFLLRKTKRSIPLNHPAVTHVHGTKWMEELQIMCDSAESKLAMNGKELQRPIGYGKDESGNSLPKLHEGDLYLCSESLAALQGCLGGVCDAVDAVFAPTPTDRAFVCIRPPGHHCSSNVPSGFCWLNNVLVGTSYAAMNHGLTHAAIIDFDLHHGDGSQTIIWDHNRNAQSLPKNAAQHKKTPIGYYSLHDINSYPCEWGDEDKVRNASLCIDNAHGQSIWNVHLEPWKSLEHFWELYRTKYTVLLEKTEKFLQHHCDRLRTTGIQPRAAIFISAGFDASQWEGQGMQRHNVNVPTEFYARFTADIVKLAAKAELGVGGRVISVLEGGYSDRALTSGVLSHLCGLSGKHIEPNLSTAVPEQKQHSLGLNSNIMVPHTSGFEPEWWQEENLAALESRVAGIVPSPEPKVEKTAGNYSSHTQASTARMTDVARVRKSLSSQLEARLLLETYDPGPPPPVDWIVASYELSRILIPTDRQTLSCRHNELNAEATKARRERQSAIGLPISESRMQLRTRGKGSTAEPDIVRAASRTSNRRTTIAAVSELPDPSRASERPRRRSSAASSILSSFQDMKLEDKSSTDPVPSATTQSTSNAPGSTKEIAAKKTRMAPPAKKTSSRITSPRKAKEHSLPDSKVTSLHERLANAGHRDDTQDNRSTSQFRQSVGTVDTKDTVDDLTSGMKKISIKLKMPTPEQHSENQRKAEVEKTKKPRTNKKPVVTKATKTKSPSIPATTSTSLLATSVDRDISNPNVVQPSGFATTINTHDSLNLNNMMVSDVVSQNTPEQEADRNNPSAPTPLDFQAGIAHGYEGDKNIPAARDITSDRVQSSPPHEEFTQQGTAQYGAVLKKTRADLPVFTSSSPIPFANEHLTKRYEQRQAELRDPVWDVPDTPKQ